MEPTKVNAISAKLVVELFPGRGVALREGRVRKLFASAITPDGLKNYLDSILDTGWVYVIKGKQGTGTERILGRVLNAAVEKGYDIEAYYCALNPNKLEHIVIPEMDVSITTVNDYHESSVVPYMIADMDELLDKKALEPNLEALLDGKTCFESLLDMAVGYIKKAKVIHDHMEKFYVPNMNFTAIEECMKKTLDRILGYAGESQANNLAEHENAEVHA